jgi:hypothetical protein
VEMAKLFADNSEALTLGWELSRVLGSSIRVELLRWLVGPQAAVESSRQLGRLCVTRSPGEREILRKAIRWVDRHWPAEPNCYRRILLEIALDRGASREKVIMGFRQGGGPGSGHAWLESDPPAAVYDALISL